MRRFLLSLTLAALSGGLLFARNPSPLVNQSLSPVSAAPGGAAFTLTVTGTGFVNGAVVDWNGSARSTRFVNSSKLTASITAADIASAATASVTAVNPSPGGGVSNVVYFPIAPETATVAFAAQEFTSVNFGSQGWVATGDLNGDRKLDVLVSQTIQGVASFLGNGDGTLQAPLFSQGPCAYGQVALGDFNNDGKLDALAVDSGGDVCIMQGNGDGTFQPGTLISTGTTNQGQSPIIADFNRDGNLDIAVAQGLGSTEISVLLGNGDGTMKPAVQYQSGLAFGDVKGLGVGDFNGDGKLDLVLGGAGISILLGNGDGTFQTASVLSQSETFEAIAVADFNGDGKLDIAGSGETQSLVVMLGNGNGTFQPEADFPENYESNCTMVADFNNDGKLDLGCTDGFAQTVTSIFFGDGTGSFGPQTSYGGSNGAVFSLALGDFNNDGQLDMIAGTANFGVTVFLQTSVSASPSSLTFATQPIGTKSAKQSVSFTNVGTSIVDIGGVEIVGPNAADFVQTNDCGPTLGAGASCTITVQFQPTLATRETAAIAVTDSAKGSPQMVPLSGTGTNELMTPHIVRFGSVTVGRSSQPVTVTVQNVSTVSPLYVGQIAIQGSDSTDFSQTNNCPYKLGPAKSCQIVVTFTPTATGNRLGSVGGYLLPIRTYLQGTGK